MHEFFLLLNCIGNVSFDTLTLVDADAPAFLKWNDSLPEESAEGLLDVVLFSSALDEIKEDQLGFLFLKFVLIVH